MEVFSKRPHVSPKAKPLDSFPVMMPEQVQGLFRRRLSDICARFEEWKTPVIVSGVIGEVPSDRWRRREATPLRDSRTGAEIPLDIPPSLLEEEGLQTGEAVRVLGQLRARVFQGQIVPRLEVLTIQRDAVERVMQQTQEVTQFLRHTSPQRRSFPEERTAHLCLLGVGVRQQRLHSLSQALGGFWGERNMRTLLLEADQLGRLCDIVTHLEQEILFLIVDEASLAALEAPNMLRALASCPAHRVLACDVRFHHEPVLAEEEQGTVVPYIVERFFRNPVEAASYIRQQTGRIQQVREDKRAQDEELAALRASLSALTDQSSASASPSWRLVFIIGIFAGSALCLVAWWFFTLASGH